MPAAKGSNSGTESSRKQKIDGKMTHCMVIGKAAMLDIGKMKLGGQDIQWCQSVKYLGVYVMAGKKLF